MYVLQFSPFMVHSLLTKLFLRFYRLKKKRQLITANSSIDVFCLHDQCMDFIIPYTTNVWLVIIKINFNCIFFRKSMQLDLNKTNKKLFYFRSIFNQNVFCLHDQCIKILSCSKNVDILF